MPADYLSYWKPQTADRELQRGGLLGHSSSEQYRAVSPGDTLWILTAWSGGYLTLLGRLVVDEVADHARAAQVLGTADLWEATYHVLAVPGTAEPLREVDLSDIAPLLRFESDRDRLKVSAGRVHANQLQSMRRLTPASAEMVRRLWDQDSQYGRALDDARSDAGAGFGEVADNREVERAAVSHVSGVLRQEGWQVTSVESQRIGYDLRCCRDEEELHVEVKGARGAVPAFTITEGERRRAETDDVFELAVVTEALSEHPKLRRLSGGEFLEAYRLVPLAYRAMPLESDAD